MLTNIVGDTLVDAYGCRVLVMMMSRMESVMYVPLELDEVESAIGSGIVASIPCKKTLFWWKKECDAFAKGKGRLGSGLMLYADLGRESLSTISE
jgi:hypothetical protein